jgi:hypothetical protein
MVVENINMDVTQLAKIYINVVGAGSLKYNAQIDKR